MKSKVRKIVRIDEARCNGCGLCVPSCHEGAIRIIDGKARLVADNLCDGLGNCLGQCPQDAITIEERPAEEFDEQAVNAASVRAASVSERTDGMPSGGSVGPPPHGRGSDKKAAVHSGCPGSMARKLTPPVQPQRVELGAALGGKKTSYSALGQWPVQLALVPVSGPIWNDADVLICADCVPFAYADFHEKLLAGKSLAIACPKLDDVEPYVAKLAQVFAGNSIRSVTVAHMEVPCCMGIVFAVRQALEQAGRTDIPVRDVTIGIDGTIKEQL